MIKLVVIVLLITLTFNLQAQGLFDKVSEKTKQIELNGYTRGVIWCLSEKYDYTSAFGEFCLKSSYKNQDFAMFADLRFRKGYLFNEHKNTLELKEAYASYRSKRIAITLGQQIINWGTTDGFSPTDNITPKNYFFLTANPYDQRMANFLFRSNWQISRNTSWEIIAIPIYKPSIYRYELFNLGNNTTFDEAHYPDVKFENGTYATRLSFELKSISLSILWFSGYDPFYGFSVKKIELDTPIPKIWYKAAFYRKETAGLGIEIPVKNLIVKTEIAANFIDKSKNQIQLPNNSIAAVGAIEIPKGNFLLLLQYIGAFTLNYIDLKKPVAIQNMHQIEQKHYIEEMIFYETAQYNRQIFHQQEKLNHAFSFTARQMLAYQTLELEVTTYYNITSKEWMLRPNVSWKANQTIRLTIGAQLMNGETGTVFYHASKIMNGVFVELKTAF